VTLELGALSFIFLVNVSKLKSSFLFNKFYLGRILCVLGVSQDLSGLCTATYKTYCASVEPTLLMKRRTFPMGASW
jgi:hypothetical protein